MPAIVHHVRKLHDKWACLKKSINKKTECNLAKQAEFLEELQDLFDIAHQNAMSLMKIEEDKAFLLAQREKGRKGSFGMLDREFAKQQERKRKKIEGEEKRSQRSEENRLAVHLTAKLEVSSEETDSEHEEQDFTITAPAASSKQRVRGTKVLAPEVLAALDRTQTSNRTAARILIPFANQLKEDAAGEVALSPGAIRNARHKFRFARVMELKTNFKPTVPLTLHWDGKMMTDLTGREVIDRLPILVSGAGVMKLLAVPKLRTSTADATATAIMDTVDDWELADRVRAFCFDTTAVNTGRVKGACVLLEQKLRKPWTILHLACRHHVLELVLQAAFCAFVQDTTRGPIIELFQDFRDFWPRIVVSDYKPIIFDEDIAAQAAPWTSEALAAAQELLQSRHPRNDYREFLELVIAFLGGIPRGRNEVRFIAPGPIHRARWMQRAIYAFKIVLFWDQCQEMFSQRPSSSRRDPRIVCIYRGLLKLCLFVAQKYFLAWFSAADPTSAPRIDLDLLQFLARSAESDPAFGPALNTFQRHLWYLSEVNIALALFDEKVSIEEKRAIVTNMTASEHGDDDPPVRVRIPDPLGKTLADFASANSMNFFHTMDISTHFLADDPQIWKRNPVYEDAVKRVRGLQVVNDTAERGVALIQEATEARRTMTEEQMQFLCHIVEENRKRLPTSTKRALMGLE